MLKAIIFDVDGTLAETEEVHRAAFNRAFEEAGLGWHWSAALYGALLKVTGGKERIAHFIEMSSDGAAILAEQPLLIANLHRHKTAIYAEMIATGGIELRPGVAELIEGSVMSGIRLAIATTTSRPNVDALLKSSLGPGGPSAFEVIAAGDSVAAKKPAPDIFIAALAELRLRPNDALAIEDSANGLRAAIGAGLPTLVTPSRYSRGEDFTGATHLIDSVTALLGPAPSGVADCAPSPSDLVEAVKMLHARAVNGATRETTTISPNGAGCVASGRRGPIARS